MCDESPAAGLARRRRLVAPRLLRWSEVAAADLAPGMDQRTASWRFAHGYAGSAGRSRASPRARLLLLALNATTPSVNVPSSAVLRNHRPAIIAARHLRADDLRHTRGRGTVITE